jgi:hypothetical protein
VAFIRILRSKLVTAEVYDAVVGELDLATEHPLGLISHAAGETDGYWQLVEIWESETYARRFDRERLIPAIEAATGAPPPGDVPPIAYEIRNLITP